jgi:flagella basal body P-ring formation protein FlgA
VTAELLFTVGVKSKDDLWKQLGSAEKVHVNRNVMVRPFIKKRFNGKIDKLCQRTGIEPNRLITIISNTVPIRTFVLFDASRLPGFTLAEVEKLFSKGSEISISYGAPSGRDFTKGIKNPSDIVEIDTERLTEVLAAQGAREAESNTGSWLSRHWSDITLVLMTVLVPAFALRAAGILQFLPSQLTLKESALFAAHNLERGHVIRLGDFYRAGTATRDNYFHEVGQIEGLIVETPLVARDRPIRHEDVMRLQVVAVKDIAPGSLVTPETLALKWTKYEDGAAVDINTVKNHRASRAIRSGDAVL